VKLTQMYCEELGNSTLLLMNREIENYESDTDSYAVVTLDCVWTGSRDDSEAVA
jgi:hypothetical protein